MIRKRLWVVPVLFLALTVRQAGGQTSAKAGEHVEARLIERDGHSRLVWLVGIDDDSLRFRDSNDSTGLVQAEPLSAISQITLVRHASAGEVLLASVIAGGVGAALGFMSGDDPPGWFSMTAEEKAVVGGAVFSVMALVVGGVVQMLRAVDVEIPLDSCDVSTRREVVRAILGGTYQLPHPIFVFGQAVYHKYSDGFDATGYSLGARIIYKPRAAIDLSYQRSGLSKWRLTEQTNWGSETTHSWERRRFTHLTCKVRLSAPIPKSVQPYGGFGLLWQRTRREVEDRSQSWNPLTGERSSSEYRWAETTAVLGYVAELGLVFALTKNLGLDVWAGRMLTEGTPWEVGAGIQFRARQ